MVALHVPVKLKALSLWRHMPKYAIINRLVDKWRHTIMSVPFQLRPIGEKYFIIYSSRFYLKHIQKRWKSCLNSSMDMITPSRGVIKGRNGIKRCDNGVLYVCIKVEWHGFNSRLFIKYLKQLYLLPNIL